MSADPPNTADWIIAGANVGVALAAGYAAWQGRKAVNAWREELAGRKRIEVLESFLNDVALIAMFVGNVRRVSAIMKLADDATASDEKLISELRQIGQVLEAHYANEKEELQAAQIRLGNAPIFSDVAIKPIAERVIEAADAVTVALTINSFGTVSMPRGEILSIRQVLFYVEGDRIDTDLASCLADARKIYHDALAGQARAAPGAWARVRLFLFGCLRRRGTPKP